MSSDTISAVRIAIIPKSSTGITAHESSPANSVPARLVLFQPWGMDPRSPAFEGSSGAAANIPAVNKMNPTANNTSSGAIAFLPSL